jgi:hypothetical protein
MSLCKVAPRCNLNVQNPVKHFKETEMTRPALILALLLPATALGQYGPPALDLRDAVKILQDVQRLIDPAIAAVRDDTAVLAALAKAEKQLKDPQPMSSFDDAGKVIEEFLQHRANIDPPLSKDLQRTIGEAQRILQEGRSLMNVTIAREKLHHEVVHPLQRQVIRNADQLQQLSQQLAFMSQRMMNQTLPEALNAAAYASTDER